MQHATTPYRLTVVGLGPGTWNALTNEAAETLLAAETIYLAPDSVWSHSIAERISGQTVQCSSDDAGAEQILRLATQGHVLVGLPGSPALAHPLLSAVLTAAPEYGVTVQLVRGMPSSMGAQWLTQIDAAYVCALGLENGVGETPGHETRMPWRDATATAPLLVQQISPDILPGVRAWLLRYYPPHHRVYVTENGSLRLAALDALGDLTGATDVTVPPLSETDNVRTFAGLMQLTRTLRAPGGCPWDREQTHATLKPHLLEETYEVLDALDTGDPTLIAEEMGDLLFQITIHSQVAAESGTFTIEDVIQNITMKLVGRHPHVFGDEYFESAQDVRQAWETLKQREKPKRTSILEQIPRGMPALPQSNLMQKRASGVGFVWPTTEQVFGKVREELHELQREVEETGDREHQREELGDLFFTVVGIARHLKIDPEEALRMSNHKFARRFQHVEAAASARGVTIRDLSPGEVSELWNDAKVTVRVPK